MGREYNFKITLNIGINLTAQTFEKQKVMYTESNRLQNIHFTPKASSHSLVEKYKFEKGTVNYSYNIYSSKVFFESLNSTNRVFEDILKED